MRFALTWKSDALRDLAEEQFGVVSRSQLRGVGVTADVVAEAVTTERWTLYGGRVVVLQNVPPTREQRWWIGVLHASDWTGETAALCAATGAEADGLSGFETDIVHVVVRRGVHVPELSGFKFHESRRFEREDIHPARRPQRTVTPRSVVDMASWKRRPHFACVVLAAAVQQRICLASDLRETLDRAGRIRHAGIMRRVLGDIEGGAHSLSEIDVGRLCRRWGLQQPLRQTVRRDAQGRRRYLDCEWRAADGRRIVLEVDGGQHMQIENWWNDMARERFVVLTSSMVLRCSSVELRLGGEAIAADLLAAGVPRELSASAA